MANLRRAMRGRVLIVDDDKDISGLVAEILREEGFVVAALADARPARLEIELARFEPDVVLLDGGDAAGYGRSWDTATWMHERSRPVAVIMFTAQLRELAEAEFHLSERSNRAAFVGFIAKPFELQSLIDIVARAVEQPQAVQTEARGVGPPTTATQRRRAELTTLVANGPNVVLDGSSAAADQLGLVG